jgi:CDP-diglyceride synthetase
MTLIVLAIIACYIALMFKKYRTKFSVILTIALCIITTTGATLWGLWAANPEGRVIFFYSSIGRKVFILLIAAWYIVDLLCSIRIIRNYIEYRKFNPTINV